VDRVDPTHTRFGVESVASILTRMAALLQELDASSDAVHVLCTHGDVASTVLCAAGGHPLTRHREVGATENGELRLIVDHDIGRAIPMPSRPLV
jgi:broad specificity phosphatase PhoE